MTETIDAIYADGVLRPVKPLRWVPEHSLVSVTVRDGDTTASILDCVGTLSDEDAREMENVIRAEFEKVNADEWK